MRGMKKESVRHIWWSQRLKTYHVCINPPNTRTHAGIIVEKSIVVMAEVVSSSCIDWDMSAVTARWRRGMHITN